MSVQARFFVREITEYAGTDNARLVLVASGRGAENKSWAKYTPSGTLEMHVNNPDAVQWFREHLGRDVALVFQERPVICPTCKEETGVTFQGEHQQYIPIQCPNGHVFDPAEAGYPPKER